MEAEIHIRLAVVNHQFNCHFFSEEFLKRKCILNTLISFSWKYTKNIHVNALCLQKSTLLSWNMAYSNNLKYHTSPKTLNSSFYYYLICIKYCCMYGKQHRPTSDDALCGV